jgi:hypothetical protein
MLRPWVRGEARRALDTDATDAAVWQDAIAGELVDSGAVDDAEVIAAAQRLLVLADPAAAKTFNIDVGTNYGAVGEFHAPVTFQQGPLPPTSPAAD